jgi:urea transport system permease protein
MTPKRKLEYGAVALFALVAIVVVPLLNATAPAAALHVSDYQISLYGKYLCYAILAVSVDLLWGYTGLLSLGQALFFALGGYMVGMYLMRMIGSLGQYHQPIPDFLVFLGWSTLPPFWRPFSSFAFAVTMAFVLPGALAWLFGYLGFRSRIRGVYFAILTQALTYGACLLFFRNTLLMGGNNGFTDFRFMLGFNLRHEATQRGLYVATAILLTVVYCGCRWLSRTKFGLVQQAIRDQENRVLFSGYAAADYKLFVFVLAALIAAAGGILYVPQVGIINPSEMSTDSSLEAVVWVAVGGRGTLVGPILGAIGVNALKSWATQAYPDLWLLFLGLLFIIVVLFLPGGIVSLPSRLLPLWRRLRARRGPAVPPPAPEPEPLPPAESNPAADPP